MKMKSVKIVLAIAVTFFVFGTPLYAQGTDSRIGSIARERNEHAAAPATSISKEEAQKKYPARGGAYAVAQRDSHDPSGVVILCKAVSRHTSRLRSALPEWQIDAQQLCLRVVDSLNDGPFDENKCSSDSFRNFAECSFSELV